MQLKFIKTNKCPVCGCEEIVKEEVETEFNSAKIREHCNGGRWEHREFACGYKLEYIPNFHREEIERCCSFDPEVRLWKAKRMAAKDILLLEIEKLDVDPDYKRVLKERIQCSVL